MATRKNADQNKPLNVALLQASNDIGVRNVGEIFEKEMSEPMKESL